MQVTANKTILFYTIADYIFFFLSFTDKQKLESQLAVVTEELKKAHTARVKMEQSYAVLQETYEKGRF